MFLQLKTQLNETRAKLQNEQSERKKVADDLHKVRHCLARKLPRLCCACLLSRHWKTALVLLGPQKFRLLVHGGKYFHMLPHLMLKFLLFVSLVLKNSLELLFDVYNCFVGMYVCLSYGYLVPLETRRVPWTPVTGLHMAVSFMSLLQTRLMSSGRAAPAPSCWATSLALQSSKIRFAIVFYKVHLFAYEEVYISVVSEVYSFHSVLCASICLSFHFLLRQGLNMYLRLALNSGTAGLQMCATRLNTMFFLFSYSNWGFWGCFLLFICFQVICHSDVCSCPNM